MSILTIFRGLPGSGKSYVANKLASETGVLLIEPDALLISDGRYQYSQLRYEAALCVSINILAYASQTGADIIFADCLPRRAMVRRLIDSLDFVNRDEYHIYVHDLKITVSESMIRNTHNVRKEDIERMAREWEDWEK